MVQVSVRDTGDLHCDATHGPSQAKISTDAPSDNKGKGETFSPTDLVATALATCISTTMGIKAEDLGVDLRGMTVSVQKEMSKDRAAPDRCFAFRSSHPAARPIIRSGKSLSKPRSIVPSTKVSRRKSIARLNFSGKDKFGVRGHVRAFKAAHVAHSKEITRSSASGKDPYGNSKSSRSRYSKLCFR